MNNQILKQMGCLWEHEGILCSLKEASYDSENDIHMTDSLMHVVNFDQVKTLRSSELRISQPPTSADALYRDGNGLLYLIEFKNGCVHKADIFNKIYDSIVFLLDRKVLIDLADCAKRLAFILVYNSEKYHTEQDKIPSWGVISNYFSSLGHLPPVFDYIARFKGYCFNSVCALNSSEFNVNFVKEHDKGYSGQIH